MRRTDFNLEPKFTLNGLFTQSGATPLALLALLLLTLPEVLTLRVLLALLTFGLRNHQFLGDIQLLSIVIYLLNLLISDFIQFRKGVSTSNTNPVQCSIFLLSTPNNSYAISISPNKESISDNAISWNCFLNT